MSLVEAMGRVEQLRSLVGVMTPPPAAQPPAPAAGSSTDFARTLSGATTAPPAGAAALSIPAGAVPAGTTYVAVPLSALQSGGLGITGTPAPTTPAGATGTDPWTEGVPSELVPLIEQAAAANNLDPALVAAVARAESGFRVDAGSPAGARGLMQLMPSTAAGLGVTDILDPAQNLNAGARYLRMQLDRFGDTRLALAAYNAGPGAVSRYGGIPPYEETRTYVTRVMDHYDRSRGVATPAG